ncbi:hypothetical protein HanPI659440_Chr14g0567011 [Helianthus annuus]|nr:hypothetical protein HanPI659440_Chr14g0567011 [Helianthus annuus]
MVVFTKKSSSSTRYGTVTGTTKTLLIAIPTMVDWTVNKDFGKWFRFLTFNHNNITCCSSISKD